MHEFMVTGVDAAEWLLLTVGACGIEHEADVFRDWSDSYTFGAQRVYNPWDVSSYASALMRNPDALPRSYWRHSSGNGMIRELAALPDGGAKAGLERS